MHQISKYGNMLRVDVGQYSIIGTREEQQDAVSIDIQSGCVLATICDGMGGLDNGQQASICAIETLRTLHKEKLVSEKYPDFFLRAVDILDESVCALRHVHHNRIISGTTIVSAVVTENQLFWLSVGDSRLYIVRGEEIVCATTDHNYNLILNKAYHSGEISEAEYRAEAEKGEALISYIGMGGIDMIDMNSQPFALQSGDIIMLTSDGLYRCLSMDDMFRLTKKPGNAQSIAERLIERSQVNASGNQDNTSVIVIKVDGEDKI